jgi:hypothetical protein
MWKFPLIFLCSLVFISSGSNAQQSGRIYFRDSTVLEISEFTKLRNELYYYHKSNSSCNKENVSIDFIKDYSLDKIREITFTYEKDTGTDKFSYQLLIEGITADGSKFRKKIKTWDWLEMTTLSGSARNTKINFYTEKKRLELVKIEFDN